MKTHHSVISIFIALMLAIMTSCSVQDDKSSATGADLWEKHKGNCDDILKSSHAYSVSQLTHCTKMWEMYRYVDSLDIKERSMYAKAFSKVSHLAENSYDRSVADAALTRICIPRHPISPSGEIMEEIPDKLDCAVQTGNGISGTAIASTNPFASIKGTVRVREVSDKDAAKSQSIYKKATSERRKNSMGKAIKLYQEALEINPFNVAAKYDLACALSVVNNVKGALKELEELYTWDDYEAEQRLTKARMDSDFDTIRNNPNFKLMTGYVQIAVVNGAGESGQIQAEQIKQKLEKKNFPVSSLNTGHRRESVPVIWYRPGFEDYANQIKSILGFSQMAVSQIVKPTSDDDILVVWGDRNATADDIQLDPVIQSDSSGQGKSGNILKNANDMVSDTNKNINDTKSSVDNVRKVGDNVTSW